MALNEKNKDGGNRLECKVIQQHGDQWCKDNGYPIQRRKYWQKRKWIKVLGEDLVKLK